MFLKIYDRIINVDHIVQAIREESGGLTIVLTDRMEAIKLEGEDAKKAWEALNRIAEDLLGGEPLSIRHL